MAELGAWGFITGAEGARQGKGRGTNTSEEADVDVWDGSGPGHRTTGPLAHLRALEVEAAAQVGQGQEGQPSQT